METQKKFYLSCPLTVSNSVFQNIISSFRHKKFAYEGSLTYYVRGEKYSRTKLENCDVFIIKHQNNRFNFNINTLTEGCRKELKFAIDKGLPILLSYYSNYYSENRFYNVEIKYSSVRNEFIVDGITGPITSVEEINTKHIVDETTEDKQETDAYFESKRRGEMWHDPVKPYKQTVEHNNNDILLLLL